MLDVKPRTGCIWYNLKQAFELAEEVENICHQYFLALKLGQPKNLSFAEMQKILEKVKGYKKG